MENNTLENTSKASARYRPGKAAYAGGIVLAAALIGLGVAPRLKQHNALVESVAEARQDQQDTPVEFVALGAPKLPVANAGGKNADDNSSDITLPASIQAIEEATISARTTGYLRRRYVDIGSRVQAGQLLAEIESPEVDQQRVQAQAQTAKSQAGTSQAEADVARLQASVSQSNADLLKSQAALAQARSARSRAKAKLASAFAAVSNAQAKQAQTEEALAGKKADLEQIQAQLDLDQKSYQRWQELGKQGAISQQDVDTKDSAYRARLASVTSAQAAIRSAQADVDAAKQSVQASKADAQAAQEDVVSSGQDIQAAQAQVSSSRASVTAAQASVDSSRASVRAAEAQVGADAANAQHFDVLQSFEKVVAPFSGVITRRDVDNGALITAGSTGANLFGLAHTDTLRILVNVPQSAVSAVHTGQTVGVLVREFPGRSFTGTIAHTAGALDPSTRTLLTEIHVANPTHVLMPGMYVQVRFSGLAAAGVNGKVLPRIPSNTLVSDAAGIRVATITPQNTVHFVNITPGRDFGTEMEVSEGLSGNERLITNPSDDLQEGQKVRGIPAAAPPDPNAKK